jgi:hypothetical protein
MRYVTINDVLKLYRWIMEQSGGTVGILSMESLESAVAQPRATFDGKELYPSIIEKAAALGYSLIMNHAFIDGINGLVTLRWKHFWYSTTFRLRLKSKNKKKSFLTSLREISNKMSLLAGSVNT